MDASSELSSQSEAAAAAYNGFVGAACGALTSLLTSAEVDFDVTGNVVGDAHDPALVVASLLEEQDGMRTLVLPLLQRVLLDPGAGDELVDAVFAMVHALLHQGCAASEVNPEPSTLNPKP
jgi:hypothetical protein